MSFATDRRLSRSEWYVWCHRCGKEIGTMRTNVLSLAMVRTAGRGGVLCPECRKKSCKICGEEIREDGNEEKKLCFWCDQTGCLDLDTDCHVEIVTL
jgi:hypothetical protein